MSAMIDQAAAAKFELDRLSEGLAAYKKISGRTSAAILVQKGGQLIYGNRRPEFGPLFDGLATLFEHQVPGEGQIWAAARARGFRVGRRQFGGDLSPKSYARAREMMGGNKSILVTSQNGYRLKFVRRGERKARVHFRHGRKSFAIAGDDPSRRATEHPINLRAVATFFELQRREQGRRFLAASWLFRRWRKLAQSDPRRGRDAAGRSVWRVLQNVNPRSEIQPLGRAGLEGNEKTGDLALRITSFVPGVMSVGTARGLFFRAINSVRADLDRYIARKHAEELVEALQKGRAHE